MKCSEIQELFGVYWDLPNDDLRRAAVDEHILTCAECAEEFQIWEESTILIRTAAIESELSDYEPMVSGKVMNRIYENESWRIPVSERMYAISYTLRRNLTAVIAFCLALFVFSFLFAIVYDGTPQSSIATADNSLFDLQAPQALKSSGMESMNGHKMGDAVASLNPSFMEPLRFHVGPIHSYPHYLLVVSILGLIATIIIMNWLSRTKA
ncbi:zf-HC2 domain-containing protein [Paenibacillus frigoriresistens]|uniref:anti-sigma factor family protein n=1 Tax=Paenibacillus alginolyticus TaxID=59839 RepID=UPI001564113C|nr:zf-HC2 domain-containing protein [Paenibacillus frigoriresistens]NRF89725.1 zf-HC2 domain-containing protein [Paenibacillus frigoriresistens]